MWAKPSYLAVWCCSETGELWVCPCRLHPGKPALLKMTSFFIFFDCLFASVALTVLPSRVRALSSLHPSTKAGRLVATIALRGMEGSSPARHLAWPLLPSSRAGAWSGSSADLRAFLITPLLQLQGNLALAAEAPLGDVLRTDSPKLWLYNRLSFLLAVHLILGFFLLNEGQKKIVSLPFVSLIIFPHVFRSMVGLKGVYTWNMLTNNQSYKC